MDLPCITEDLPGITGRLRVRMEDFVVEEIPAYEPLGTGPHTYVRITKRGLTSTEVRERLARLFGLRPHDIGMAGLKDRYAVTTQTFSVPQVDPDEARRRIQEAFPDLVVHEARRHTNKLKPGHLRGNRFRIVLREAAPEGALVRAQAIARRLREVGAPNYYGPQRFGKYGDNAERGKALLLGRMRLRDKWLRKFLLSAYQSALFNVYLAERIRRGWFTRILAGDIAKKADTGGLFLVEDPAKEQSRYHRGEIHFTGPMYGYKLWWAQGEPGALEEAILRREGLSREDFRRGKLKGARRLGRLWIPDLTVTEDAQGNLVFVFTLPKGAYATAVLREFLRDDALLTSLERDASEEA